MSFFLWAALPYIVLTLLIGGIVWRWRYDRFGWTTRSSQAYESALLRIASPLFHFGLLAVIAGHFVGLVVPESWTTALGLSPEGYHVGSLVLGVPAAAATLAGVALLVWRRRTKGPVFNATTKNDKTMYVVLALALLTGTLVTLMNIDVDHDYRGSVSVWFRSVFVLDPDVAAMESAPVQFHVHAVVGMLLIACMPFTRLVHAFAAPVGYLWRPYVVYRARDGRRTRQLSRR
ncbi:respiratory nitrate reductase subunit gamma [Salininema proteolyticum]|uniref:Respiratory nitrate reductase subunit gamma n=1 Tax=Salininema proteolyticum TaxID=1607685 RepID=A0ABV8U1Z2_9ACTN